MAVDNSAWDGSRALSECSTASDFRSICAGEHSVGEPDQRQHWALPHHFLGKGPNADGVRNALSRLPQTQDLTNKQAAQRHLDAHMAEINPGNARADIGPLETVVDMKADSSQAFEDWLAGKKPRRLLAIPYYGSKKGKDLDNEYFSPRTDIKPDWFKQRPLLFHHGQDSKVFKTDAIGYTDDLTEDEIGKWVNTWLDIGRKRQEVFRRFRDEGGKLYGSSGTIGYLKKAAPDGEILVWPYVEQTLSPAPQNDLSVLLPAKAVVEHFDSAEIPLDGALKAWLGDLDDLGAHLPVLSDASTTAAKAGRVLSAANEKRLREALATFSDVLEAMARANTPKEDATDG